MGGVLSWLFGEDLTQYDMILPLEGVSDKSLAYVGQGGTAKIIEINQETLANYNGANKVSMVNVAAPERLLNDLERLLSTKPTLEEAQQAVADNWNNGLEARGDAISKFERLEADYKQYNVLMKIKDQYADGFMKAVENSDLLSDDQKQSLMSKYDNAVRDNDAIDHMMANKGMIPIPD